MSRIVVALVLSLAWHGAFLLFEEAAPPTETGEAPIPVVPLDEIEERYVDTEPSVNPTPPKDTKFVAKDAQTVERQTRAPRGDRFQSLTMKDLGVGGPSEWIGGLDAATDDKLEDIPLGRRTALNTRETRYHSFYQRIKEVLRHVWKPDVEARASKLRLEGELVTRVRVYLDPEGRVTGFEHLKRSGTGTIDEAAEVAFRRIGVFPNPPPAMVDRDGRIRLHWEFIVYADGAPEIRFTRGSGEKQIRDR